MSWDAIGQYAVALVALIIALGAWLYPRQAKKAAVPNFVGIIDSDSAEKSMHFITKNEDRVVRIRAVVPMTEDDIWSESDDDEGNAYHGLSLKNKTQKHFTGKGLEISIHPEKGSKASPMTFANGEYHLNGFFVVKFFPGVFQGWYAASITELSAEQLALRS